MSKIKVSDYVMKFIESLNVKHVFLLPGGGCMHLVDSLGKSSLTPICCLHEQSAAIMADAYSQYTNNIGVALVTTGPGSTNAITGVAASWIDSIPVLIISGQAKTTDMINGTGLRQKGVQEVDIVNIVRPITKFAHTITCPDDIKHYLKKAVHIAKEGRQGPVWIDIPLDVQGSIIDEKELVNFTPFKSRSIDLSSDIVDVIRLINSSRKPVILAGNGIRLSKAEHKFINLVSLLNIPVLTTWKTIDFFSETHPLYFGRPGSIASRYSNFILQNSDLVICIGARLDLPQTGFNYSNFAPKSKKIIVDIDQAEIKKLSPSPDVSICIDAKIFIEELLKNISLIFYKQTTSTWMLQCKEWKNKYPVILPEYLSDQNLVNPYALINTLSDLLTTDDIIIPGSSGTCSEMTLQSFCVKHGQRVFNSPGLGSMGFGLPASIGACIASGGKRTISIIGDGGLQHNIQELETLRRLNLPIKLFIINNNGYASIRNTHNKFFDGRLVCCDPSSGLTLPDTCKISTAYGLKSTKISNQYNLANEIKDVLDMDGTVVCEVMINPDVQTIPKMMSMAKPDGSMVSMPMENLYPFLDEDEFNNNMR